MTTLKNTFKVQFFLLFIFFIPTFGFSQIQGSVLNMNNQPLSFANILLLHSKDSSVVSGAMATEEGTFNITNFKPGNYIVSYPI